MAGLQDISRPVIEARMKEAEMKAAFDKDAPRRMKEVEKAAKSQMRSISTPRERLPTQAAMRAQRKDQEEGLKAGVVQKALDLIQRHRLEVPHRPNMRFSLAENQAILHEVMGSLALKRGREGVDTAMKGVTLMIQKVCSSDSPIKPLRELHAEGPPSLSDAVCHGDEWDEIIQEITLEYGRFFADMGPFSRYAISIASALALSQAFAKDPAARERFQAFQKNLRVERDGEGSGGNLEGRFRDI